MVVTIMNMKLKKISTKETFHREDNYFNQEQLRNKLRTKLNKSNRGYDSFEKIFIEVPELRRCQPETKNLKTKTQENLNLFK